MRPADVPAEWVEKATEAVAWEMPACGECGECGPPRCVYCKDDAERYARDALAAVLPDALAEAWDAGAEALALATLPGADKPVNPWRKP